MCPLLKTLQHKGIPLNSVRFRVASPSMHPFSRSTSYQKGDRSSPPPPPLANCMWSSESSATLPEGAVVEGAGRDAPTPDAPTTCSATEKAWTMASDIPKAAIPGAGSGPVVYSIPSCVSHPPGYMPLRGEGGGIWGLGGYGGGYGGGWGSFPHVWDPSPLTCAGLLPTGGGVGYPLPRVHAVPGRGFWADAPGSPILSRGPLLWGVVRGIWVQILARGPL